MTWGYAKIFTQGKHFSLFLVKISGAVQFLSGDFKGKESYRHFKLTILPQFNFKWVILSNRYVMPICIIFNIYK